MEKPANLSKMFALAGVAGPVLSAATILGMAAWRDDGYSHLTKAVSELGSLDAPHRMLFNFLGYIAPGLLIAVFAYGLGRAFTARTSRQFPFVVLAASGLFMALAGIFPMDMAHRTALGSIVHTVGSLGSGLAWLLCTASLAHPLRSHPAWAGLAKPLAALTGTAVMLIFLIGAVSPATPGLGQRISFAAYFAFVLVLAVRLLKFSNAQKNGGAPLHV